MAFTPDTLATLAARDRGYPQRFGGELPHFAKLISNAFGTTRGQLLGTATNDAAAAGYVGEVLSATQPAASGVALTTNTAANVLTTALTLTAGDWEISATLGFTPGATTSITRLAGAISATSATFPATTAQAVPNAAGELDMRISMAAVVPNDTMTLGIPVHRVSVATTSTLYLVSLATFTVSTLAVFGHLRARRAR